jgi:hypothetical protein
MTNELTKMSVFDGARVRRILFNNEWYFSIVDVCNVLVESADPGAYWRKLKQRLLEEGNEVVTFCHGLKLEASDGKKYQTDCANTQGIFRIIQSIPSPKAEPFKQWLAKIGKERIDEIENPELGIERARTLYAKKGYSKEWIEKRIQGISIRQKLTDEWVERGAKSEIDYAILTNEIMQGAFDLKVNEHKKIKGLVKENLRDHMTDLELIITMLGEATTTQLSQKRDSREMPKLKVDAKDGGAVAGRTRQDIEKQTGIKVVSKENFLPYNKKKSIKTKRVKPHAE